MLIKEFAEATGLPRDTVRYYIKRGLLTPSIGSGEGNRYQVFDAAQVERARVIRVAQRLGFSLKQIEQLAATYEAGGLDANKKAEVLRSQMTLLAQQERDLRGIRNYLTAKLRWLEEGERGPPPGFDLR